MKEWLNSLKYLIDLSPAKRTIALRIISWAIVIKVIFTLYIRNTSLSNKIDSFQEQRRIEIVARTDSFNNILKLAQQECDTALAAKDVKYELLKDEFNAYFKGELDKIKNTRQQATKIILKHKNDMIQ